MKAKRWFIGTVAAILGTISSGYAATDSWGFDDGNMLIWVFLGMCALIVVGQLLPAFRATKPEGKLAEPQTAEARAVNSSDSPSGKDN